MFWLHKRNLLYLINKCKILLKSNTSFGIYITTENVYFSSMFLPCMEKKQENWHLDSNMHHLVSKAWFALSFGLMKMLLFLQCQMSISIYSFWRLIPSENFSQKLRPRQKSFHLSLYPNTHIASSIFSSLSTFFSCMYSFTLSFHLITGLPLHFFLHYFSSKYDQTTSKCFFSPIQLHHTSLYLHKLPYHTFHKCFHWCHPSISSSHMSTARILNCCALFYDQVSGPYDCVGRRILFLNPLFTQWIHSFLPILVNDSRTYLPFTALSLISPSIPQMLA